MTTTYDLSYTSRAGRVFQTELSTAKTNARLWQEAVSHAIEEITMHDETDQLEALTITLAGPGDRARR